MEYLAMNGKICRGKSASAGAAMLVLIPGAVDYRHTDQKTNVNTWLNNEGESQQMTPLHGSLCPLKVSREESSGLEVLLLKGKDELCHRGTGGSKPSDRPNTV